MGLEGLWHRKSPEHKHPEAAGAEDRIDAVRRGLMQLLLGVGAYMAITAAEPPQAHADTIRPKPVPAETIHRGRSPAGNERALFMKEKQRILDETIDATTMMIQSHDVQEALHWKGWDPLGRVVRAVELPILPSHLDGTTYDVSKIKRTYPVQLVRKQSFDPVSNRPASTETQLVDASEKPVDLRAAGRHEKIGYGNGFYFGDASTLVTCEHVAREYEESVHSIRRDFFDISVVDAQGLYRARRAEQVIPDDPKVTDADINGLVTVVGTDPDALGDTDGKKVYPGIPVKLTPEFAAGLMGDMRHVPADQREELEWRKRVLSHAYMITLPPGEARPIFSADKRQATPAFGMSGSPVFKNIGGAQRLVGILVAVISIKDKVRHRYVDAGFFLPISAIRSVAANEKRWNL